MTTLAEKIAVMQAFERGEAIQCQHMRQGPHEWEDALLPSWNWDSYRYRIRPKAQLHLWAKMNGREVLETSTHPLRGYSHFVEVIE